METEKIIEILTEKTNTGYASLAKWIISLSSGIIVFSVNLIAPDTPEFNRLILTYGLGLLVITILFGVIYVRYGLDGLYYNLSWIKFGDRIEKLKRLSEENKKEIEKYEKLQKKQRTRGNLINKILIWIMPAITWCFIFGVALVVVFAYFQMK